jgi:hypothetical protein
VGDVDRRGALESGRAAATVLNPSSDWRNDRRVNISKSLRESRKSGDQPALELHYKNLLILRHPGFVFFSLVWILAAPLEKSKPNRPSI